MCGIAGIFAYAESAPPADSEELIRVRDAMRSRGPDGEGLWLSNDRRVALAHRRLAIIDLSPSGAQPMSTSDKRLHVTFNGEIYNYRALRAELEGTGYRFRSNSDTEVLLHLYAERGAEMVHALRGMYAFAIWDAGDKTLFLARDPFGIKPLYYADDGATLRFASQVKALLEGGEVDTTPEPAGAVGFLVLGSVPEPYTLYKGIKSLPSGSYLRASRSGTASITRFFDVGDEFRRAESASNDAVADSREILKDALADSVRHHLVADVPVGVFLSAGLDSTTIAGLASAQERSTLKAVTLGFREFEGTVQDEVPIAATVARQFGFTHEAHWITRPDFESEQARILDVMDQPSIDGVNTYFVSRAAARAGMKVALSGIGGDELLGGYPSFRQVPALVHSLRLAESIPSAGRLVRRVLAPFFDHVSSPKYAGIVEYGATYGGAYLLRRSLFMPWELGSVLDPATIAEGLQILGLVERLNAAVRGLRESRSRVALLELNWYMTNQLLRDADWAGMAHSLEIRVPMVDVGLFRALAPLIVSKHPPTKGDLAQSLAQPLPAAVSSRQKTGFVTPISEWVSHAANGSAERGLRSWAKCVLSHSSASPRADIAPLRMVV